MFTVHHRGACSLTRHRCFAPPETNEVGSFTCNYRQPDWNPSLLRFATKRRTQKHATPEPSTSTLLNMKNKKSCMFSGYYLGLSFSIL